MLPVLEFWKEDGDETQPMVYLVKKISERANAYARSSAKDAVLHALVAAQLMIPGVDLTPLGEFQSLEFSTEVLTEARQAVEEIAKRFMNQLDLSND